MKLKYMTFQLNAYQYVHVVMFIVQYKVIRSLLFFCVKTKCVRALSFERFWAFFHVVLLVFRQFNSQQNLSKEKHESLHFNIKKYMY